MLENCRHAVVAAAPVRAGRNKNGGYSGPSSVALTDFATDLWSLSQKSNGNNLCKSFQWTC